MKIAFYRAKFGGFWDKVIRIVTLSRFSHCEMVLSNGECWSSSYRDGGVRCKIIELGDHWEVYNIDGDFDEATIRYWFQLHDGDKYDVLGAIASLFRIDLSSENKKFCSEACAIVLGIDPAITPKRLFKKLKQQKIITI